MFMNTDWNVVTTVLGRWMDNINQPRQLDWMTIWRSASRIVVCYLGYSTGCIRKTRNANTWHFPYCIITESETRSCVVLTLLPMLTSSASIMLRTREQSLFEWEDLRMHLVLQTIRPNVSAFCNATVSQGIIHDKPHVLSTEWWLLSE
jgi:hypothetical protein